MYSNNEGIQSKKKSYHFEQLLLSSQTLVLAWPENSLDALCSYRMHLTRFLKWNTEIYDELTAEQQDKLINWSLTKY